MTGVKMGRLLVCALMFGTTFAITVPMQGCAGVSGDVKIGIHGDNFDTSFEGRFGNNPTTHPTSPPNQNLGSSLIITDADIWVTLENGAFTNPLDDNDSLTYVAQIPIVADAGVIEVLENQYEDASFTQTEDGLEVSFSGSAVTGLELLNDVGFESIYLDQSQLPEGALQLSGRIGSLSGSVIRIGFEQRSGETHVTYNGLRVKKIQPKVQVTGQLIP